LTDEDINAISGVDGVEYVNGIVSGRGEVSYLSETVTLSIEGINPSVWSEMTTSELDSGRFIDQGEDSSIVIGSSVASDVFDGTLAVNTQIEIEEKTFKIVGILEESGMGSFGGDDRTVLMSNDAAREILADFEDDEYSSIEVKVSTTEDVDKITDDIENALFSSRGIYDESDQDFTVTSQASMAETVTSTIESVTMFIVAIAAISLIVGAIGIANTMFMSVMERTKLIGILKSLGTKNSEIMKLYLIESAIIGFTGGVMGVFLGLILTGFVNEIGISIAGSGSLSAIVTLDLIPLSLAFSTFIGVISGLIPAKRAASLQIVEAMRSGE